VAAVPRLDEGSLKADLDEGGVYLIKLPANTFVVLLSLGGKRALVLDSDHRGYSSLIGQETLWRWLSPDAARRIA